MTSITEATQVSKDGSFLTHGQIRDGISGAVLSTGFRLFEKVPEGSFYCSF